MILDWKSDGSQVGTWTWFYRWRLLVVDLRDLVGVGMVDDWEPVVGGRMWQSRHASQQANQCCRATFRRVRLVDESGSKSNGPTRM